MKKWSGGVVIICLALILFVSYSFIGKSQSSKKQSAYDFFNSHPDPIEEKISDPNSNPNPNLNDEPKPKNKIWPKPKLKNLQGLNELYRLSENVSSQDSSASALLAWAEMKILFPRSDALPETVEGIKEAVTMCKELLLMIDKNKAPDAIFNRACPSFVTASKEASLEIPCGLVEDSSVTVIGIPDSQDSFQIELVGSGLKPPIVLQYKVLLPGQNFTKEAVTIQNSWTQESGWGKEEKCPDHGAPDLLKVDGLVKCNTQVIRGTSEDSLNTSHPENRKLSNVSEGSNHESATFHFVEGNPFTATLWAGNEGFHMTVNGRHETSYVYRERLEPWSVNSVNVKGGLTTVSVLAKGLPVSEDVVDDAQQLKAVPLSSKRLLLLIGVFSSGNNFERRMAIRRTWMQYDDVRLGEVAVRFFIGLHKNKEVNFKIWKEAQAYGDIQLMPFVDYYSLLTYKTIAICILGTKVLSARYIMKIDDDAFVRIDEVLSILKGKTSNGNGLLYGRISFDAAPHRDKDNKWFISEEEWPHSSYPPWAHGPGYILSEDIARFIVQGHQDMDLMLFKLEDVAVGIWIEQYKEKGRTVEYVTDDKFYNAGCEAGYVLAHYQNPRMMLCLWEKLLKDHKPECCD